MFRRSIVYVLIRNFIEMSAYKSSSIRNKREHHQTKNNYESRNNKKHILSAEKRDSVQILLDEEMFNIWWRNESSNITIKRQLTTDARSA